MVAPAQDGCQHHHGFVSAKRGIEAIMRSPQPLTRKRGAYGWHFVRCGRTRSDRTRARRRLLTLKRWRRSYSGYWTIHRARISPWMQSTLARLRWCESTNNYQATNGSHWGGYQYADSTWARAQAWVGAPAKHQTWRASVASPAHQDAVTARFFPAHRSEWACSA